MEINGDAGEPKSVINPDTESALDAALRESGFNPDGSAYEPKAGDITPKPEDKKEEPKPGNKTEEPKPGDKTEEPKPGDKTEEPKPGDTEKDDLDSVELPPHTKPKTAESFANVKNLARQKISALQKERDELKAKYEAADKLSKDLPEDTKKELEELRNFRRQMDVEADPTFKSYDASIASNEEALYSKLAANNFGKDAIEQVKKMGAANVDWDKLAADGKISSSLKRFIDGKLFENDDLVEKKKQAIETAKKNAAEFLKKREAEVVKSADEVATEVNKEWSTELLPKMDWFHTEKIDDKMTPEKKAVAEAHNKLVAEVEQDVKEALADTSPRMKALMIAGYAQSRKLNWEFLRLKEGTDAKIKSLEKELSDAKGLIDRIKKASPGRVTSSAPQNSQPKKVTEASHLNVPTTVHLDNLLAEVQAEEAARS